MTAAIPDQRAAIAVEALQNGKDVVTDKPGCISLDELDTIKQAVSDSGRFWSVTFSERFEVRAVTRAVELVRAGRIGQVIQTIGLGPHKEGDRAHLAGGAGRPDWFYDRNRFGGIITDIASHQIDQFLWFTGLHLRRGGGQHGRQLHPSRVSADAGLRRGAAAQRHRPRLHPGRLVHPAGLADLGRRTPHHPRHRGLSRAAQVHRHRRAAGGSTICSSSTPTAPNTSTAPTPRWTTTRPWSATCATAPTRPARRNTPSRSCAWPYSPSSRPPFADTPNDHVATRSSTAKARNLP